MKVRITMTTVWDVTPADENMARKLIQEQPADAALDYLTDAAEGSVDLSETEVTWEQV